jgi:hypothetical protein
MCKGSGTGSHTLANDIFGTSFVMVGTAAMVGADDMIRDTECCTGSMETAGPRKKMGRSGE